MKEIDYFSVITQKYQSNLADAWVRIQNYYNDVSPGTLKGIKGLDPEGNIEFWNPDYGLTVSDFKFNITNTVNNPVIAHQEVIDNNGDTTVTHTFAFTKTETDSFTFGFTEGLKIGTKASGKAGIPFVTEGSVEVSADITFGASQQWIAQHTTTLVYTDSVPIPPKTHMQCVGFLNRQDLKATFTASCYITMGTALTWFQLDDNTYTEFEVPINVLFTKEQLNVILSGNFSGGEGTYAYAKYDPIPQLSFPLGLKAKMKAH